MVPTQHGQPLNRQAAQPDIEVSTRESAAYSSMRRTASFHVLCEYPAGVVHLAFHDGHGETIGVVWRNPYS